MMTTQNNKLKNSRRRHYALLILLFVAAIAIICGLDFAYYTLSPKPSKTASHTLTTITQPNIAMVINRVASGMATRFPSLQNTKQADTTNTVGYPLAGYSFAITVPYSVQSSVSFNDPTSTNANSAFDSYQAALPSIEAIIKMAGFQPVATANSVATGFETVVFFERSDAICQVTSYSLLDIYCDSLNDLAQIAVTAQPLVSAYINTNSSASVQSIAEPIIQPSKTGGYTIASIVVYGANGETKVNLYKQGSGNWQTVNLDWYNDPNEDADIQPNCADFNSLLAVRQAFAGIACYDSAARSHATVQ
jgi:hypothetical protein